MKKNYLIFLLMFLYSCGLKITTEVDDNVLLGSWELSRVKCYLPTTATSYVEDYDFDSDNTLTVTIDFVNSNIQYMVSTNSCSTSATGVYSADFNGTGKGLVTLSKIVLGATTTCDVDVPFVGNGAGNGTGSVKLTMNSNFSSDLNWQISDDRKTLTLDMYTGFNGSAESLFCATGCNCQGTYSKTD